LVSLLKYLMAIGYFLWKGRSALYYYYFYYYYIIFKKM